MSQAPMASFAAHHDKTRPMEGGDQRPRGDPGPALAHDPTVTRWTPTNSFEGGKSSSSRHSSIASRIRFMRASNDLACVWHPRNSGTVPTKNPSVSRSMITLNCRFMVPADVGARDISLILLLRSPQLLGDLALQLVELAELLLFRGQDVGLDH